MTPCGRCKKLLEDGEFCWYCHGRLCGGCWEEFGECGHPEATVIVAEAQSYWQAHYAAQKGR